MTWVHEHEDARLPGACLECIAARTTFCTTPTPDPASPCGYEYKEDGAPCGFRRSMGGHEFVDADHPHQPTRCTCGHPIKEAADGDA